ncbi:MAG: DUF6709 family protein [Dysgonomonas sp.]|nr:DUF6709 family protein [Dysgonomonas sp.]
MTYLLYFGIIFILLTLGKIYGLVCFSKSWKRFAACGNPTVNEQEFDKEFADKESLIQIGKICITKNWIFCSEASDTFLMPISSLKWVYERQEKANSKLILTFNDNSQEEIWMKHEEVVAVLNILSERNKETIVGYSEALGDSLLTDEKEFEKQVETSPKLITKTDIPPFVNTYTYYETIVYVVVDGKKTKCHLALTHDFRVILTYDEKVLFDEEISCLIAVKRKGIGRFSLIFDPLLEVPSYTIKSYNTKQWRHILKKAMNALPIPQSYREKSYHDVDSYNYAMNQNKYYIRFVTYPISALFFSVVLYFGIKEDMIWEDGIFMGILTYFIFPITIFPILIKFIMWIKGFHGQRIFPNRKDGE